MGMHCTCRLLDRKEAANQLSSLRSKKVNIESDQRSEEKISRVLLWGTKV